MPYTFNDIQYPGVTTVIGLLDKSPALMGWAVKLMGIYILENKNQYLMDGLGFDILIQDAKARYREVSEEAKDIGSAVHNIIERYIKAKMSGEKFRDVTEDVVDEITSALIAFWDWEKDNIEEWIESEKSIFEPELGYAGTLDAIAKIKKEPVDKFLIPGGLYVIDFKSSKGFYDGYDMQIAAYRYARENLNEETGKVQVTSRTGEYEEEYSSVKIDGMGVLRLDKETGLPEWKDYSKNYEQKLDAFKFLIGFYYRQKNRRLKDNPIVKRLKEERKKESAEKTVKKETKKKIEKKKIKKKSKKKPA